MTLANAESQFGTRLAPKTLDRLALDLEAAPKYVTAPDVEGYGIQRAALLEVARVTRSASGREFDHSEWCGTKCCAIGHYCRAHPTDDLYILQKNAGPRLRSYPLITNSFEALSIRFGITIREACDLFTTDGYEPDPDDGPHGPQCDCGCARDYKPTRDDVADRIEQLVKDSR